MLTIWGRITSVNVQKVVWAAGEVGQPFERLDVGGSFGGNRERDYLARNPNGLIPVLEDGEVSIWESGAIVRYLAARYGSGWIWDEDPARRAEADRWMDWAIAHLQPEMMPAFLGLIRLDPAQRDPVAIDASVVKVESRLDILEAHLEARDYLAGERFGMADIVVGPYVHRWLNMPVLRARRPHLQRWYEQVSARPAAQAALALPVT